MRSRRGARSAMRTADYRAPAARLHGPEGLSSRRRRPISRNRTLVVLAGAFLALALAAPATGSLKTRLDRALRAQGVSSSQTGAAVYDLPHSRFVYRHNALRGLKPASNEKLPVAVTALSVLGPTFKIPTQLRAEGRLVGGVLHGRLILKGFGDPSLASPDLGRLAKALVAAGVTHV